MCFGLFLNIKMGDKIEILTGPISKSIQIWIVKDLHMLLKLRRRFESNYFFMVLPLRKTES